MPRDSLDLKGKSGRLLKHAAELDVALGNGTSPEAIEKLLRKVTRSAHQLGRAEAGDREPRIVRMADVERRRVSWLWPNFLPRGKLTLLVGDPSGGKTCAACWIAAMVTTGAAFPDPSGEVVHGRDPANVVYLSAEDDLADTLGPRLDAAGADSSRVYILDGINTGDEEGGITLADVDMIERTITDLKPELLIADPVQGFLRARMDMHRANEVRAVLSGVRDLAEDHGCAIMLVAHLSKSSSGNAMERILGSRDFAAAARSILFAGAIGTDQCERALLQAKRSISKHTPGIAYDIVDAEVQTIDGPTEVGLFKYLGATDLNQSDLLERSAEAEANKTEEAVEFLRSALENGQQPASKLYKEAEQADIHRSTLKRAKTRLRVRSSRASEKGGAPGSGEWVWSLPEPGGGTVE